MLWAWVCGVHSAGGKKFPFCISDVSCSSTLRLGGGAAQKWAESGFILRELFFALTGMQSRAKKSSLVRGTQDGHRVSREGGEGSHIRADKRQCIVGGSRQICGRHLHAGSAYLPQRSLDSGPMHKLLWVPVPFRILGWEEDTEDSEDDGEDEDTDDSDSGGHDDDEDDEYEDGDDETRR